ncbi:MAG: hypothetical protein RMJ97_03880 [Raineya sp.]|nr:hypothetical protein [Raineya sp.]MDW8296002.1 hypothetical protein [Raineya sp.]
MQKILQHIEPTFGKRFICFSFLFVFTYLLGVSPNYYSALFFEKTTEAEKEETKTEKEGFGEESEEIAYFGKCKKIKKSPDNDKFSIFVNVQPQNKPLFLAFGWVEQPIFKEQLVICVPACPLYIVYHQLIFYES